MLLPLALWTGISGQRVLEPPKLRVRVPAKGAYRPFGQKELRPVHKPLAHLVQVQIVLPVQAQELQRVGIAAHEEGYHLSEREDYGVRIFVLILLMCRQSD